MIDAVLPVYRRSPITIVRGEGSYLFDDAGKRYLDFATGIAVNALGHGHPHLVKALKEQAETLWHCSNLYQMPLQRKLAERLVARTFADSVFFCSSGTEAVEASIKMARRFFWAKDENRYRIITLEGAFHGRTYAGISACGHKNAVEGYGPVLEGFDKVPFGDLDALAKAVVPETAAALIEPVQGEGGIRALPVDYLQGLRRLCDEKGLLLICDEVQCGYGRTGHFFAFERAGIAPDIAATAKGIGNGFPLAAVLVKEKVGAVMVPGSHGSTYGANPLAMAVGNAVLDIVDDSFLNEVKAISAYLHQKLDMLVAEFPAVFAAWRGEGLMLALVLQDGMDYRAFAESLRHAGLMTAPAVTPQVIRILPPLNVSRAECDEAYGIIANLAKVYE